MIIEKIFNGNFDSEIHNDFIKFSRGEFKDRYLIDAKKQANKWAVKTSCEFSNFLVRSCISKCKNSVNVSGIIATTLDLKKDIKFEVSKISQFQGVKKYIISTNVNSIDLIDLMDKYPRAFFALSFKNNDFELKIKAKPPKSGKSGKDEEEIKADFCTLKTNDDKILNDFFFDTGINFKEAKINHTVKIENIIYPKNIDGMKPAEIRENSKRQGVLVRNICIDGNITKKEAKFIA